MIGIKCAENRPKFALPYYLIPERAAHFFKSERLSADIYEQITIIKNGETFYKLFVHPSEINYYSFLGKEFGFAIYPETAACVPNRSLLNNPPETIGGQIIREIPDDVYNGEKRWITFQTLLSPIAQDGLMMFKIIQKSNLNTSAFIHEYLINKYLTMLEEITFKRGILFQSHLQNLCLETDSMLNPTGRFVLRDFSDMGQEVFLLMKSDYAFNIPPNFKHLHTKRLYGKYLEEFGYFYKKLIFAPVMEQLKKHDNSLTNDLIENFSHELDTRFLAMVEKYCGIRLDRESLKSELPFPAIRNNLLEFGRQFARDASKIMIGGEPLTMTSSLKNYLSQQIQQRIWHDLGGCFPPGPLDQSYINAFLSLYQFYKYKKCIIAKDKENEVIGILLNSQYPAHNSNLTFSF